MSQPIRTALLGTGHGHALGKLRVLRDSPDWELVGVCEPDPAWKARREADPNWAGVRWLEEAEVLDDPALRMVAVESEVQQLLPLARRVIDAGKHLHLDKPAGTDLAFFRALLADAEQQGLLVQLGYMFRYQPGFDLVRKAAAEGWLGRIHTVNGDIPTDYQPDFRLPLAFHPGGMMLELGCHLIDMVVLLLGRPERVTPFLRHDGAVDDALADNTLAVFEFPHALATIRTNAMEPSPHGRRCFQVIGDAGSIFLQPLEPPAVRLCLRAARGGYAAGWQDVPVPNLPRYVLDLEELAACLREERALPYSPKHELIVQETVLRACGGAG